MSTISSKKNDQTKHSNNNHYYEDKCSATCYIVCPSISMIILVSIIFGVMYPELDTINFKPYDCLIENVTYPILIVNASDQTSTPIANGFVSCDCGKYCTSEYGICIKLWAKILDDDSNQQYMLYDSTTDNKDYSCTFQETECENSHNMVERVTAIENARQKALSYLNTNQTCYKNDNEDKYYLNNEPDMKVLIICFIVVGITLLCCLYLLLRFLYYNFKNRNYNKNIVKNNGKNVVIEL